MKRTQTGLTLVEVLVAVTLGLLVLAGVVQIFASTNQTAITQTELARVQENSIFAKEYLLPQLRLADRTSACVADLTIRNHLDTSASGYVDELFNPQEGIVGWNYTGTDEGDSYSLGTPAAGGANPGNWLNHNGNFLPQEIADLAVAGSDVLYFKYATPVPNLTACNNNLTGNQSLNVNLAACPGNSPPPATNPRTGSPYTSDELHEYYLPLGSLVLVTDCSSGGDLFQKTNDSGSVLTRGGATGDVQPGNDTSIVWTAQYGDTTAVYTLESVAFFVGVGVSGNPALFRYDSASRRAVELIDNVDNMQVQLGQLNGNTVVYSEADDVTAPERVVSARVSLLMRTEDADLETDEAAYALLGVDVDPQNDRRLRKVVDASVSLRNRGRVL